MNGGESDGTTKVSELVKITSLVESGQISTYTVTEEHDIIVIIGGAGPFSYGSNNKGVGLEQFVSSILHNGCYVGGIANAKVGDTITDIVNQLNVYIYAIDKA